MVTSSLVERMYDEYRHTLYKRILSIVRSHEEAEDLVHETFIKFSRSTATFTCDSAVRSYLYRAATNVALDRLHHYQIVPMCPIEYIEQDLGTSDPISQYEQREQVEALLSQFEPEEAQWFALMALQRYTAQEIAAMAGTTPGAIKMKLTRARQRVQGGAQ